MYGIFTYTWLIFMVDVGKYAIHWASGHGFQTWNVFFLTWVWPGILTSEANVFDHGLFGGDSEDVGVSKNRGTKKMDGEDNGKPY